VLLGRRTAAGGDCERHDACQGKAYLFHLFPP
jgi:hypothetical protein